MTDSDAILLKRIVSEVRSYRGIRRKSDIAALSSLIAGNSGRVIAAKGEDGAVLSMGGSKLVFAADGIMEDLVDRDPKWAGYCSVLVNVNDMLAMCAEPIAAVNVISAKDRETLAKIVSGMNEACEKFDVQMVGGHLHPDANHNEISVSMLGEVRSKAPLLSTTAKPGDAVVVICDCKGKFTPGLPYSWDCTSARGRKETKAITVKLLDALQNLSSGKDISNPGILGTLAMLLESSGTGADIEIAKIPIPDGIDLLQWLKAYQGLGFIGTIKESKIKAISAELKGSGMNFAVIGKVTKSKKLIIRLGESEQLLFNLASEKITGLF